MTNRYLILFFASVIILVSALVGYGFYVNKTSSAHVEKLAAAQYSIVRGVKASYREITPTVYIPSLNLNSSWMLDIHVKLDGTLVGLYVQPGDKVREGQLIGEIINDELPSQVLQAEAKINGAKANYIKWDNTVRRYQTLIVMGGISQQQLDEAAANRSAAAAEVASDQAYRDQLASRLESQKITAPQAGDVLKVYHASGAFIRTGQPLVMIGDFSVLFARLTMRQAILEQLLSSSARFKLAVPENQNMDKAYAASFRGKGSDGLDFDMAMAKVEPPVTVPAQYRSVVWKVDNRSAILEPGTYHQVKIYGADKRRVLAIPKDALTGAQESQVFIVTDDSRLEQRRVRTGIQDDHLLEVLEGIRENDIVVISGKVGLAPGTKVQVTLDEPGK